jgi:hypothetical protein
VRARLTKRERAIFELKVTRERRQGYGARRRIRDARNVYVGVSRAERLHRDMFVVLIRYASLR